MSNPATNHGRGFVCGREEYGSESAAAGPVFQCDVADISRLRNELAATYGHAFAPFAGRHHSRYLRADTPYHVISRVFQGRYLLRPNERLNRLIAGVLGRAQMNWPGVKMYAYAFMSNHAHLMLQGEPEDLVRFIAFIKREISRRWGDDPSVGWEGTMWCGYLSTALPTADSQLRCLRYIVSQGVKEGLVAVPQDWPGLHCSRQLLGATLRGEWFDGTAYGRARDSAPARAARGEVRKADYYRQYEIALAVLPAWHGYDDGKRRDCVRALLVEIEEEGRQLRRGRRPLGAKTIRSISIETRSALPAQPWFEKRQHMVCWADPREPAVRAYVDSFWAFQRAFQAASLRHRGGGSWNEFPVGAFIPGHFRRVSS